ncbi:MAG: YciI family protein [Bacteroidota bacterium]
MTQHDHDDLTPEEQRAFGALPRHRTPPQHLEESIMNELTRRGLLTTSASLRGRSWFQLAAALLLLILGGVSGYGIGTRTEEQVLPKPQNPRYVLLLFESPNPSENTAELVREYGQWAQGLYTGGRFVSGEKLRETGRILTRSDGETGISEGIRTTGSSILGGYFIIEAKDYDEAIKVASECPHLKYGGTIELREIEPT